MRQSRRAKIIAAGIAALLTATSLSACRTPVTAPTALTKDSVQITSAPSAKALRKEKRRQDKLWRALAFRTEIARVSTDRMIVEAHGVAGTGIDKVEFRLLARAAAETKRLGYSHFAIVHIGDRNLPIAGSLFPDAGLPPERLWIGSYEDLISQRAERTEAAAPKTWIVPGLEAVIVLINDTDKRAKKAFNANETYEFIGKSGMTK